MAKIKKLGRYTTGFDGEKVRVSYTFSSTNSKTGNVIQQWVTPAKWEGAKKIDQINSQSVCADCPLMERCYVKRGQANMGLKSGAKSTNFTEADETDYLDLFKKQFLRFGAFGEPVLAGKKVISKLVGVLRNWTGYTHRWKLPEYQWAKDYLMASCDSNDWQQAEEMGWRQFIVIKKGDPIPPHAVNCPASEEAGKRTTCENCGLCKGNGSKAKSVWIYEHN
jgi:hypothetical protein